MAHNDHRSRSNTAMSARSRPLSRASTTSVQSYNQHDQAMQLQAQPSNYIQHQQHTSLDLSAMGTAAPSSHMNNISAADSINQIYQQYNTNPQQFDPAQYTQFIPAVSEPSVIDQSATAIGVEGDGKKKGSASGSAANDKELRELLKRNEHRALPDVAHDVKESGTSSKAEKTKQLFAMLWLRSVCKPAKTSVPRSRVYSKYAERCGTERVIPLNPASFGKLVRVIFPGISTRRLGIRGASKYHYVDLALINDAERVDDSRPGSSQLSHHALKRSGSVAMRNSFNSGTRLPTDTAAFPNDRAQETHHSSSSSKLPEEWFYATVHPSRLPSDMDPPPSAYTCNLKFAMSHQLLPEETDSIVMPDITSFLPNRPDFQLDKDNIESLVHCYRCHCTALIDLFRYGKKNDFFNQYTQFHGTMTVPVRDLFQQPEIAGWILQCDWMMYQKMIRNVAHISLQVAPPKALKFLDTIQQNLYDHLCNSYHTLPRHTLRARLEACAQFTHLIRLLNTVNSTAHAAALVVMNGQFQAVMKQNWEGYINLKRVTENILPVTCDHEEVLRILGKELPDLLFRETIQGIQPGAHPHEHESVIDRVAKFLVQLPTRFENANALVIKQCVKAIGDAICREITIENCNSFQGWWLLKVFVDEMCSWLSVLGGFLEQGTIDIPSLSQSPELVDEPTAASFLNGSNNESRYSSIDADFNANQSFMSNTSGHGHQLGTVNPEITSQQYSVQPESMSFPLSFELTTSQHEPNHDDSGIGLGDDTIDAKFASNMHQSLTSHLTQLPTRAN